MVVTEASLAQKKLQQREKGLEQHVLLQSEVVPGKACIFKWIDEENPGDKQYIWLGLIVSIVAGHSTDEDCQFSVRWCPNDKESTWRARLSEHDQSF